MGGSASDRSVGVHLVNCTQTASAHTHDPRAFLHSAEPASRRFIRTASRALAFGLLGSALLGCEVDSWFDPSRTGRFETTPTTMPVLARLDVIEEATFKGATVTPPTMEDLVPQELKYRLAPGDEVRVDVFELITPGEPEVFARTIDQTGNVRLPEVGEIAAAGRTVEELQQAIELAAGRIIANPVVTVSVERQQGLQFTISGAVGQTGIYALTRPDLRLSEAIAIGGGTLPTTQRVKVIRAAPLDDTLKPNFPGSAGGEAGGAQPGGGNAPSGESKPSIDINELIEQIEQPKPSSPGAIGDGPKMLGQDDKPAVDIDDLSTPKAADAQVSEPAQASPGWVFDAGTGRWVRGAPSARAGARPGRPAPAPQASMYATRIIEIDYQSLVKGDPNLDIVIRPADRIYVEPPETGFIYIDGEVARPGVYSLENDNGRLTLSRFVSAAGGLGQLAIPNRVDLIRVVGKDREATIRVDLAAIRNRSEPDIYMRPDDHVIIGTSFFATPLAVIRNGFRMTYGFGFLLDRNFGNDVFGPPPESNPFN